MELKFPQAADLQLLHTGWTPSSAEEGPAVSVMVN